MEPKFKLYYIWLAKIPGIPGKDVYKNSCTHIIFPFFANERIQVKLLLDPFILLQFYALCNDMTALYHAHYKIKEVPLQ